MLVIIWVNFMLYIETILNKNDRIISTVYYLHPEWQEDWGGQLRLQDKMRNGILLIPNPIDW